MCQVIGFALLILIPVSSIVYAWRYMRGARADSKSEALDAHRCIKCGYDLRGGNRVCPECGTRVPTLEEIERDRLKVYKLNPHRLRDDWPADWVSPRIPDAGEQWVDIHETDNSFEADLLQQQLEARGVPCQIRTEEGVRSGGPRASLRLYYFVAVPSGDKKQAEGIVARFRGP